MKPWFPRRALRRLRRAAAVLRSSIASTMAKRSAASILPRDEGWEIVWARRAASGMRVAMARRDGEPAVVIKVADSSGTAAQLLREGELLHSLHDGPLAPDLLALVPVATDSGIWRGSPYLVQQALPGSPADRRATDPVAAVQLTREASAIAARIHRCGSAVRRPTPSELEAWVDMPLRLIAAVDPPSAAKLGSMRDELHASLERELTIGVIHGDLWPANILIGEGEEGVTGIVDWDSGDLGNLALHDQLHLVLYGRKIRSRVPIGTEVCRALGPMPGWDEAEAAAVATATADGIPTRSAILTYWLRLVTANAARQPATTARRRWISQNVTQVVECL